jgi:hypothetical protein
LPRPPATAFVLTQQHPSAWSCGTSLTIRGPGQAGLRRKFTNRAPPRTLDTGSPAGAGPILQFTTAGFQPADGPHLMGDVCNRRGETQPAPRGAWRVHGRQEGLCSLARFLLGRKPRLRRPAARADGLASNSPTRLIGCALLAVNAPPSGRSHAPLGIGAPSGGLCFDGRGSAPAPPAQPELSRVPLGRRGSQNESAIPPQMSGNGRCKRPT